MSRYILYGIILQSSFYSFAFSLHSEGQVKKLKDISLKIESADVSLIEAFDIIQGTTEFTFAYRAEELPNLLVTIPGRRMSLRNILEKISAQSGVAFRRVNNTIHAKLAVASRPSVEEVITKEPPFAVSGRVYDENQQPLPGATVLEKGTGSGTITDSDGKYSLTVASENAVLVFSFVGYIQQEVEVNGRSVIDLTLAPDISFLQEIVVVGYGAQEKAEVTGAVETLEGNALVEQPVIQTSAALMGKIPGIQVIQDSGQPGQGQGTIRIRGIGTLGNSNPLVLIDGVPGDLNDIPSKDIDNISVLKDASSAAVFGSRAANGVILVTTKRGTNQKLKLSYSSSYGWKNPTDQPEFSEGGEFMRLENLAATNLGKDPIWSQEFIDAWEANHQTDPDNFPNTDWVDEVFSEPGFQQQQHLSARGGNERVRYFGSLNFDDDNGTIKNFGFTRYSIRLNTDVLLSDKVDFVADLNVQRSDREEPSFRRDITRETYRIPPVFAARFSHGGWGPGWNGTNPVAGISDGGSVENEQSNVRARLKLGYEPIEALKFDLVYSAQFESRFFKNMRKQYEVTDEAGNVVGLDPSINFLDQRYTRDFTNYINFTANYEKSFQRHYFGILGGYEFIDFRTDFISARRENFILQDFEVLNAGGQANLQNGGNASEWNLQSFFSRVNYNYDGKYLVEGTVRYDGSSRFTKDNRWGLFPSVSVGWVLSEESFMSSVSLVDLLKVRLSWGVLGNQQIGTYPASSVISLGQDYIIGGAAVSGAAQIDLANTEITWEETTSTNIGFDASLFQGKLDVAFDYFTRETSDILLELPIPLIVGFGAPFQNAGVVENRGWEFAIGYKNKIGQDFNFDISVNISDVTNEVTDLKDAGPSITGNTIITVGEPIGAIFGFESDGLFQTQEEIDNHATQFGELAPGDIKYVDQLTVDSDGDGTPDQADGVINDEDRVIIGDPFPSFNYGINLRADFKNFDLKLFFQGIGSRDVLLQSDAVWAFHNAGKIRTWQAADFWSPENPGASYPRLTQASAHNNFRATDFWVFDASYLRLRNLQIGYSLPEAVLEGLPVSSLRVYLVGQNLFTLFDDLPDGVDPNVPNNTDGSYFVLNRLYGFGLSVKF